MHVNSDSYYIITSSYLYNISSFEYTSTSSCNNLRIILIISYSRFRAKYHRPLSSKLSNFYHSLQDKRTIARIFLQIQRFANYVNSTFKLISFPLLILIAFRPKGKKGWREFFNRSKRGNRVFLAGEKASKRRHPRAEAARNYIVTPRVFNLSTSIRVLPRVTSSTTRKLARFPPPPCSHAFGTSESWHP